MESREKANKTKQIDRILRSSKRLTEAELTKEADAAYAEKIAREDNLIKLYQEKKLKSESLIDETKRIIKKRGKQKK